jgi:hypothetical protein
MTQEPYHKDQLQISFDPKSKEQTTIITIGDKAVTLNATETNDLLEWLYQKRDTLFQYEMVQHLEQQKG